MIVEMDIPVAHFVSLRERSRLVMENGLEAELDDELGYSKYNYKNKDTDNSLNGYSSKTLRTSFWGGGGRVDPP